MFKQYQWPVYGSILLLLYGSLFYWSWGKWVDPVVDFGREIYLPWLTSNGGHLVRDFGCFQGPLSPYVNGLVFHLFGASLTTLALWNGLILLAVLAMLLRVVTLISNPFTAFLSGVVVLSVFGFSQYVSTANYNFITPYAHQLTHGFALALCNLLLVFQFLENPGRSRVSFLMGLVAGLAYLTKPEMFLVAAGLPLAGHLLGIRCRVVDWATARSSLGWMVVGGLGVLAVSFLLACLVMTPRQALTLINGCLTLLFEKSALVNPFQSNILGTNKLLQNLCDAFWGAWYLVGFGLVSIGLDWACAKLSRATKGFAMAAALGLGSALLCMYADFWSLNNVIKGLPCFMLLFCLVGAVRQGRARDPLRRQESLVLLFCFFALLTSVRMFFNYHVYFYGFVLALAGTLCVVVMLVYGIPQLLALRYGGGLLFRGLAIVAIVFFCFSGWKVSDEFYSARTWPVRFQRDCIYVDKFNGFIFELVQNVLRKELKPGDRFAVFPEMTLLNFMNRRVTPMGFDTFLPGAMDVFGERRFVSALERDPPEVIVYYHMSGVEWGKSTFGVDYAVDIVAWIRTRYEMTWKYGPDPFREDVFSAAVFRKIIGPAR